AAEEAAEATLRDARKLAPQGPPVDAPIQAGDLPDVKEQYVFTITDGGFAKRSRISEYRTTNRGGLGIKAMALANEDRGQLVGAFIVVEGDEILSITQGGQVVRSPINADFRPTGRSTMGVKFVTPKSGDAVAVVARSIEAREDEAADEAAEATEPSNEAPEATDDAVKSSVEGTDATIDESDTDERE
ncbi:MAG: DNA gyrase subunit A, partial [Nocardioidaceae bacterium]|nr:DNA gyrase subunit A [Nocardioidaceae bacterium]